MGYNEEFFQSIKDNFDFGEGAFIQIHPNKSEIHFRIQDGPIKEVGVNGCQIDEILKMYITIIEGFNKKFPCYQNTRTIECCYDALAFQEERKQDRESRGVEGENKA